MSDEQRRVVLESYRIFSDGAFGAWLTNELESKMKYYQDNLLTAESWEAYVEARGRFKAVSQFYNMVLNPEQFF